MFLDSRKRKTQSHSGRPIRTSRTAHTPTTFPVRGRLQPHACLLLLNRRRYLTATPQPATHRDAAAATPTPAFYSDITAGLLPRLSHSDTDIGLSAAPPPASSRSAALLPQRRRRSLNRACPQHPPNRAPPSRLRGPPLSHEPHRASSLVLAASPASALPFLRCLTRKPDSSHSCGRSCCPYEITAELHVHCLPPTSHPPRCSTPRRRPSMLPRPCSWLPRLPDMPCLQHSRLPR